MAQMEPLNPFRTVVDLNGDWERYIHGKLFDVISVPSSLRPSGSYRLQRTFLLPRLSSGQRAFVHFDAITYYGKVSVNGRELGSMIPYLPHEFECTQQTVEGRNTIEVEIVDAHADQGEAGADADGAGIADAGEGLQDFARLRRGQARECGQKIARELPLYPLRNFL